MQQFNPSYIGERNDIFRLIPTTAKTVLDVGCSTGTLGLQIKEQLHAIVHGIEVDPYMANEAKHHLDHVITINAENAFEEIALSSFRYDIVIFADILEHLVDPWTVIKNAKQVLTPNGIIIASIPNIRHFSTINSLFFKGYWPYRNRGIHDRTHLRFFTKRNIEEMFQEAGFHINRIENNYRIIERPCRANFCAKFLAIPPFKNFLAYQYLIKATISNDQSSL